MEIPTNLADGEAARYLFSEVLPLNKIASADLFVALTRAGYDYGDPCYRLATYSVIKRNGKADRRLPGPRQRERMDARLGELKVASHEYLLSHGWVYSEKFQDYRRAKGNTQTD